jgi:type IV pilus assembly protein PilY1
MKNDMSILKGMALLLVLVLSPAWLFADDTEIFFAPAEVGNSENETIANVMVLLDTSGSMRSCAESSASWCSDVENRRINMLEDAMHLLIDSVPEKVNMGIGRFRHGYNCADDRYTCGGYVLMPVTQVNDNSKRALKEAVSSLNSAGDNASGSNTGAPYGSTPTAESYWEMGRYMLGAPPGSAEYGNSGNDDNTRSVCTEFEETEECEIVDEYGWEDISDRCNRNRPDCRRICTSPWGWCWGNSGYTYQEYKLIGQKKECEITNACVNSQDIVGSDGRYVSPINLENQCESNHIVIFTDGDPNDINLPDHNFYACNGSGKSDSYECQAAISQYLNSESNYIGRSIKTYNVGLYMGQNRGDMEKVSSDGSEGTYTADTSDALASAFLKVFDLIDEDSRTLSAPGVAVNQLNRFEHLDQLYYAVIQPASSSFWEGNLKRYRLSGDNVTDVSGNDAIDDETGYFKETARSWWSDEADGPDATQGGARQANGEGFLRTLYYNEGSAMTTLPWGSVGSGAYDNEFFGLPENASDEKLEQLASKLKVLWGDPMHSVPVLVDYSGDNVVFVSTNGGMLHAIDAKTGKEIYSFMPKEFLSRSNLFTTDRPSLDQNNNRQIYGLDGSWVALKKDGKKLLFGGMRRGGNSYYALDVTSRTSPKLLWKKTITDSGYSDLGQTWSTPTPARIGTKTVLIFGGGYDTSHDASGGMRSNGDDAGNVVYIVDALTGDVLWSEDLAYSVPSSIAVVDKNADGSSDHLYFGDTGGHLYRVDIDEDNIGASKVHVLADLGGSYANNRRFYEAPAVAYVEHKGEKQLYMTIGSGYRAHPLDKNTNEAFFVIRDDSAYKDSAPEKELEIGDLVNVGVGNPVKGDSPGWFYYLDVAPGEKVMSSPVVYDNTVFFSTYSPVGGTNEDSPCAVSLGSAYLHTVNLITGDPAKINNDGSVASDRQEELLQQVPPPTPVLFMDEDKIKVVVGTEVPAEGTPRDQRLRKTQWRQLEPNEANVIPVSKK